MSLNLERTATRLHQPVGLASRVCLVLAAVLVVTAHFFPLWNLTMFAPQYPDALRLDIFDHALVGGNGGQDLKEINLLNHYIGMRDLVSKEFGEFKWMPFVIGAFALLFARTVVMGKMTHLVDSLVLYIYFGAFSLWSFGYKMWSYGHSLAPTAAVKVEPFMPPMFGYKQLANFEVYSYPALGSYALGASAVLLVLALFMAGRSARKALDV